MPSFERRGRRARREKQRAADPGGRLDGGRGLELQNCPGLSDVDASVAILRHLGCRVEREGHRILVDNTGLSGSDIPDDLMREMRSSIVFLGAIAAKTGAAVLSFPGGCELGPRPIDLHLAALRQLGMAIEEERGQLRCRVRGRLKGCKIPLSFPSVGATENILLAAATAEGTTTILNAAREPEIEDLAAFLNSSGARIRGRARAPSSSKGWTACRPAATG